MDRTWAIESARCAVIACGDTVSVRTVQDKCVAIWGQKFRTEIVLAHLKAVTLGEQRGNGAVTPGPHETADLGNASVTVGKPLTRRARRSQQNSKPLPNALDTNPETNVSGAAAKAADPAWVLELREAVKALQGRSLSQLDADERFLVARHHAVVYGYCRTVEKTNLAKSRAVAVSLANLRDYLERNKIDLTVGRYFTLASSFHKRIGEPQWFTPADVRAEGEAV